MLLIPLHDENDHAGTPYVTYGIIALNCLIFLYMFIFHSISEVEQIWNQYGFHGQDLIGASGSLNLSLLFENASHISLPVIGTIITSGFLHGDFFHLIFNMWFFWIFADNVEHAMGPIRFILFYCVTLILSSLLQAYLTASLGIPSIGASGAVAGTIGAYLVYFHRIKINCLVTAPLSWFFGGLVWATAEITAFFIGALYLLGEFRSVIFSSSLETGIAHWAHIGGVISGLLLAKLFKDRKVVFIDRKIALDNNKKSRPAPRKNIDISDKIKD